MRKELTTFPSDDGHIESVLVGVGQVKVSFQTWDCRKLVLIYFSEDAVIKVISNFSCNDIGKYHIECLNDGQFKYTFYDAWEQMPVLTIIANSIKIYEVGTHADINAALFDVTIDYIGNQIIDTN